MRYYNIILNKTNTYYKKKGGLQMAGIIFPGSWMSINNLPIRKRGRKWKSFINPEDLYPLICSNVEEAFQDKNETFGLGFSGGIDSCFLAYCLKEIGIDFTAFTLCAPCREKRTLYQSYQRHEILQNHCKMRN